METKKQLNEIPRYQEVRSNENEVTVDSDESSVINVTKSLSQVQDQRMKKRAFDGKLKASSKGLPITDADGNLIDDTILDGVDENDIADYRSMIEANRKKMVSLGV